jgi:hypothetical protein
LTSEIKRWMMSFISMVQETFSQIPVSEPASLVLFGSALVRLGWAGRRRRKNV